MTIARCRSCETPIPDGARFCASCGAATPTGISGETSAGPLGALDESALQHRLQQAVGEAFEIRRLLGMGGFGAVFAARDVKLQRDVAIKVLRPELLASRETLGRFGREARSVAQLRHPNVIPVYQVGESEGLAWFVMPLVEGETLRAVLDREERLPPDEVRRILAQAADALQAAHERGLVHRDIKPENIMLEGRGRRVLLMDFGIAKALADPQSGLTGTGMIIGTPQYMSPEQAGGEKSLDHRSDQYSLALLGYRMLMGVDLFEGDSLPSVIRKQLVAQPPDLRRELPDAPPYLVQAITRALAREPDERFPDMEAFGKALAPKDSGRTPAADGIDEVALAHDLPISRPLLIAGVVGLVVFGAGYHVAYRPVFTPVGLSGDSAWTIGRSFMASMGAAGSFREVEIYRADSGSRYLVDLLGRDGARRWSDQYLPHSNWHLRWFRPGEREEWKVAVAAGGRIVSFDHVIGDAAPGAQLERDSAQAIATAFLAARGWSTDGMQQTAATSQQRPARRDHDFTWLRPVSARAGETGTGAAPGGLRLEVGVRGDRVGRLNASVFVPDDVRRRYEAQSRTMLTVTVILAAVALVVTLLIWQGRARRLRWRGAVRVAAVMALGIFLVLVNESRAIAMFMYDTNQSWMTFQFTQPVVYLFLAAFFGGAVLVIFACLDAFGRVQLPSGFRGYREILGGRWRATAVRLELWNGAGLAGALLGLTVLEQVAGRMLPGVSALSPPDSAGPVNAMFPPLEVLDALTTALALAALMALGVMAVRKVVRGAVPAALLFAAVIALLVPFEIAPYPLGAAIRFPEILVMALGFGLGGWLALATGLFVSSAVSSGLTLLLGGVPGFTASGILLLLLAAAPALILVLNPKKQRPA